MGDFGFPNDHKRIRQINAKENDASSRSCDIGSVEQRREKEAQHNGGNGVGGHKGKNEADFSVNQDVAVLRKEKKWIFISKSESFARKLSIFQELRRARCTSL